MSERDVQYKKCDCVSLWFDFMPMDGRCLYVLFANFIWINRETDKIYECGEIADNVQI